MSEDNARVPPQAIEVEEGVLGVCFMEPDALERVISELGTDPDVFYKPAHRTIYETIVDMHGAGASVDMLSVESKLRDQNKLAPIGGSGTLADLSRSTSSAANIEYHCQILLEKHVKRQLILESQNTMSMGYDSAADVRDVLDQAMTRVDRASDKLYKRQGNRVPDMMESVLDDITFRRENPGIHGVPSGLPLDKYTGGWQPANVYIIAARPSIGKTALVLKCGFNAALFSADRYRTGVFYWNGEMKNEDVIKRRLAIEAKVNYTKMRDGKVSDVEMKRLIEAAGYVYNANMIIDDTPGIGIHEWRAKYKTAVRRDGVGLGIVDYLQLMSGEKGGNREQEIASISRGLKAAAKETNTPVIALSQLSRECERREGAEPFLSDLRESGSLEQDADGVIMLNRPEFFGHELFKNRPTKGKGIIKVEKMRNGMTGEFWMNFEKQFADWIPEYNERGNFSDSAAANVEMPKAPIPQSMFDEDDEWFDDEPAF